MNARQRRIAIQRQLSKAREMMARKRRLKGIKKRWRHIADAFKGRLIRWPKATEYITLELSTYGKPELKISDCIDSLRYSIVSFDEKPFLCKGE